MTGWIIEPREPANSYDSLSFPPEPDTTEAMFPFPFPSTTAGAARGRAGLDERGIFHVARENLSVLKDIQVRGPLLVERLGASRIWRLLVPAPGDALLFTSEGSLQCRRQVPLEVFPDAQTTPLRDGQGQELDLAPVGVVPYETEKPAEKQPAFWYWQIFLQWLLEPEHVCGSVSQAQLGIQAHPEGARPELQRSAQSHKSMESSSLPTATRHIALWLDVTPHAQYNVQPGLDSLGSERRPVLWQTSNIDISVCPEAIIERILQTYACRLLLLTPAYFWQGYLPDLSFSQWEFHGVRPHLRSALVSRPLVTVEWDLDQNTPRPTQRLAPAGSVFFLQFSPLSEREDIRAWIIHTWMNCLSDTEQNRRDGFGLAVLGTWDGTLQPMRIKQKQEQ